jgi:hypothetical protein
MLMLALLAAAAAPGDGKIMMSDDWHSLSIYGVGADASGPLYLQVHAGDLDGDGRPDDAIVKLHCADGRVQQALLRPRETGIGSPTERRQHAPVTFVKEWGAASPQLTAIKPTYDLKNFKGNERRTSDGWTQVTLATADGLCPAAAAAAATIVKSKSNITNN